MRVNKALLFISLFCAFGMSGVSPATASTILRIEYADGSRSARDFSLDDLEGMPAETFQTSTIWTESALTFTGVPLAALLELVGGDGNVVHAIALNDYQVTISTTELEAGAPIVAYLINGEPFSVREKGPLWIVYPYDTADRFRTELVYTQSIWQLSRIIIDNR